MPQFEYRLNIPDDIASGELAVLRANERELKELVPDSKKLDVNWEFYEELKRRDDNDPVYPLALRFLRFLGILTYGYPSWQIIAQDGKILSPRDSNYLYFTKEKDARAYAKHFHAENPDQFFLMKVDQCFSKDQIIK